jgi:glutaredoxin 3
MSTSARTRVSPTVVAVILSALALGTLYVRGRSALATRTSEPLAVEAPPRTAPPPVEQGVPQIEKVEIRPDRAEHDRRVTEAMRTVDITTYGAVWCPSCKAAHKWLDAQGIAYVDKDIEKSTADNKAMRALNPAGTIPTIDIEGQVLVGFDSRAIERAIRSAAEKRVP